MSVDKELVSQLSANIQNFLEADNFELVDFTCRYENRQLVLKALVDHANGGITMDECVKLNKQLGGLIDEKNLIDQSYTLEVSSPGLDRPLRTNRDFRRCFGKKVTTYLREPVNGKLEYTGLVKDVNDDCVYLDIMGIDLEIPLDKITKGKQLIK